jgi:CheY-like chemotaxis protein
LDIITIYLALLGYASELLQSKRKKLIVNRKEYHLIKKICCDVENKKWTRFQVIFVFSLLLQKPIFRAQMRKIKSVLIVDDDRDDVDLFREVVEEIDDTIECFSAVDGEQMLRILRNSKLPLPDMIFLDLNMPKISGKQCLVEIRKNKRWKDIPVFIYTTSKREEDKRETKKMGAFDFITKPSNYTDIYRILSQILNGIERES